MLQHICSKQKNISTQSEFKHKCYFGAIDGRLYNLSSTCHTHCIDYRAFDLEKLQLKHWIDVFFCCCKKCIFWNKLYFLDCDGGSFPHIFTADFAINSSFIYSALPRNALKRGILNFDSSKVNWFIVVNWDDGCVGVFHWGESQEAGMFSFSSPLPFAVSPAPIVVDHANPLNRKEKGAVHSLYTSAQPSCC